MIKLTRIALAMGATAALITLAPAADVRAQSPWTTNSQQSYGPSAPKQSSLDRKVKQALEKTSKFVDRAKKQHFTSYLFVYTATLAGVFGLVFGAAGYRLSDPMSPYRFVKKRTLLLSIAIGFSVGIFAAVTQVPHSAGNRITLLVISACSGIVGSFLGALASFLLMRIRSNRAARRDGRRITDRMRHA